MRAVVPDELIEERRRLGLDRRDEMWDGVLHMVPLASSAHNRLEHRLSLLLDGVATSAGLWIIPQPGVFDPDVLEMTSYRVPDLAFARPADVSERGIEGRAALAVEVLSPKDESSEKLPFYRRVGVEELLFVDPSSRAFEVRRPHGDGWRIVDPDVDGWTSVESLGVAVRVLGGRLQLRTAAGVEDVW